MMRSDSSRFPPRTSARLVLGGALATGLLAAPAAQAGGAEPPSAAAFPGANGRIVYAQKDAPRGDYELYSVEPDGSRRIQLTDNDTDDVAPTWSPDGRSIAYTHRARRTSAVYRLDLRRNGRPTGAPTPVVGDGALDPAWSPDGEQLAFSRQSGGEEFDVDVYRTPSDGSGPVTLVADVDRYDVYPAWSPDGTSIAFSGGQFTENSEPSVVYVVPAGGGEARAVTEPAEGAFGPDWSPDGTQLTYAARPVRGTNFQVYVEDATGEQPRVRVTERRGVQHLFPVFSPAGGQIAVRRVVSDDPDGPRVTNGVLRVPVEGGVGRLVPGTAYPPRFAFDDYLSPGPDWGVVPE